MKIHTIPTLQNNYTYVIEYDDGRALVVDPSQSRPVLWFLEEYNLNLTYILITHGHVDHTAGIGDLKSRHRCDVIVSDRRIPGRDTVVKDNDEIELPFLNINVIATPGHTASDVSYLVISPDHPAALFTGDTLFVSGCGRVMGSGARTLYASLCRLADFPGDTRVYVGHEYTEENCEFALSIAPDYPPFQTRQQEIQSLLKSNKPTVPSTIAAEKAANPFLLADSSIIRKALDMPNAPAWQVFAELRKRKDHF